MIIRKADITDATDLLILNEKFNGTQDITVKMIEESLENNESEIIFVAVINEKAVGFCCVRIYKSFCYSVGYAEISEIYVSEKFQHQGIGTELLTYAEEFLKEKSIVNIQLFTGEKNYSSQAFYEKNGYTKSAEIMYRKRGL